MILAISGCNGLFYHPDSYRYANPDQVEVPYKSESTLTPDGVRIALWHLKPGAFYGDKPHKGVVLQFHGNAGNMSGHFLSVAWLTSVGYHVVVFDYRGYGSSEPKPPTREGCIADGKAMLAWIQRQKDLSDMPLFILGQSLGGAVAVPVLAQSKTAASRTHGLILDSTFSSYRRVAREKLSSIWLTWAFQWPLSFLVSDGESPIDSIDQLQMPLLSVHAKNDPVVPYSLGKELFEASPSRDKEFWDIDLGGHTAAFGVEGSKYRDQLVEWLDTRTQK